MKLYNIILKLWHWFNAFFDFFAPWVDLLVRLWVAKVFFISGLAKMQSWETTTLLFQTEYQVPQLPPDCAATIAILVELIVPPLLLLGLFGRLPALILFLFNAAAVACYPFLWTAHGAIGLKDHTYWGLLLLILVVHGPGKLSLDHWIGWWIKRRYGHPL